LTVAIIVLSVVQGLLMQQGAYTFLFVPLAVIYDFQVWRPFTSLFIAPHPLEIIFGGLIVYSVGGNLESWWGRKRFLRRVLGIPLTAQLLILGVALIFPTLFKAAAYAGARQIITTIWILFGLTSHFQGQRLNFWGTPLKGNTFALIGLGFVLLGAVFNGLLPVLPELFTAGLCYAFMYRGEFPDIRRRIELTYYNWKLKRLKTKKGLRLVKGKRGGTDEDSEPHIH
jgi:membrane associated rhomboid family serine protease